MQMRGKIIFMFSGQGSQYFHMGRDLYREQPVFRHWMDLLDGAVKKETGASVVEYLYRSRRKVSDPFQDIRFTHPAIFMAEYAMAQVFIDQGIEPDMVMGASMGEYAAAAVSGVLPPLDVLAMILDQAAIFGDTCPPGGMLTILGSPDLYSGYPQLSAHSQLASVNYHSHFVVSGKNGELDDIERFLKSKDINFQRLPVEFAFHSSYIDGAESAFKKTLERFSFKKPDIQFVSCMTGKIVDHIPRDYCWDIVRRPIMVTDTVKNLEALGCYHYLDLGPSGTMANFVKNNVVEGSRSQCTSVVSPFGGEMNKIRRIVGLLSSKRSIQFKKEKRQMKVYLFPGQGSQQKGMGKDLFDEFTDLTAQADTILGYSVKELCLEDPEDKLGQTQFTQPVLYVVNAMAYLKKRRENPEPDFALGHSVAEYNALFAAGAVDFETGLQLVMKRGELMGQAKGGGMAAVMGLDCRKVEEILTANNLEDLFVANYNSSFQIVISGAREAVEKAEPFFTEAGATHYRVLNVSGAFHTPYMEKAKKKFKKFVKKFDFNELRFPVISNVTARPYKQEDVIDNIVEQITSPVRWMESIQYLLAKGGVASEFDEVSGSNLSVVKALAIRIGYEAGPLDLSEEKAAETVAKPAVVVEKKGDGKIDAQSLGSEEFKNDYNLKYAYLAGGMYKGIASSQMVVKLARSGYMGFFGTGGLDLDEIERGIQTIRAELANGAPFGMNLVAAHAAPEKEEQVIDLFIKYNIPVIEAAAFMTMSPALVKFRAKGLVKLDNGDVKVKHRVIAKLSRPEVAEQFLSPAPQRVVNKLLEAGKINRQEAELLESVPMADDICVEADSGGHTDMGILSALLPSIIELRDNMKKKHNYKNSVRVGAAGGIGTPGAAAAAFVLGADFIVTGSINQCSVEAGTSDAVKDLLQDINVQDTEYAPAADMFEMGAKVQVLKRGVFFPARANKLFDLYRQYNSLDEIDTKNRAQLEEKYFKRKFDEIFEICKEFYPPAVIEKAERNPKQKMALVFKWYFGYTTQLALSGDSNERVNFQVHCGPSLGAFNQWVKGTELDNWRQRNVDKMADRIMIDTAELLEQRFAAFMS
jgi:trans-AT polyketide synthase/acyltransferase/oxidoreductase domain-containing protein